MKSKSLKSRQFGFSLVELMVVISIIGALVSISLPSMVRLKIKAARAEMMKNTNTISTLAHAYHAENSIYPPYGVHGQSVLGGGGGINRCGNGVNTLTRSMGFATDNCEKLRYAYAFYPYDGGGFFTPGSYIFAYSTYQSTDKFTLVAHSSHEEIGSFKLVTGNPPVPAKLCSTSSSFVNYLDKWVMDQDGNRTLFYENSFYDATTHCP